MSNTVIAYLRTADLTVLYCAQAERDRGDGPRVDPTSIEILSVTLLGHGIPAWDIPGWLEQILYERTDELEWHAADTAKWGSSE